MSSEYGENIKITLFGQSHAKAMGVVMDNIPAGIKLDMEKILAFMARRAPGKNEFSTSRNEDDLPEIISGVVEGVTVGAPICAVIYNKDQRSRDYSGLMKTPRPSHADYPAIMKYGESFDIRGGGSFSGRLTAPLCFAGAICKQLLEEKGVYIGAHIKSIGAIEDESFSLYPDNEELFAPSKKAFAVLNDLQGEKMKEAILNAKASLNSVGGKIECVITGLKPGLGEPFFGSIEGKISRAVFCVPAIKGIEFGAGFEGTKLLGSQFNDAYTYENQKVVTKTNNNGGILGGLTNGCPVKFTVAVKPTPSIGLEQDTINLETKENAKITVGGRHDPCIVPRAVPCIEAVAAIAMYDMLAKEN